MFICAPLGGNVKENLEKVRHYAEYALKCGDTPIVPHYFAEIAQQFGLDSSVKVNVMNVVHATTTAVNLSRTVSRAIK